MLARSFLVGLFFSHCFIVGPIPLLSQEPRAVEKPYGFDEQMKEIDAKEAKLERVRMSPDAPQGWKERIAIEAKLRQIHETKLEEQQPLFNRLDELNEVPSVAAWAERVRAVENELRDVSRLSRGLTLKDGGDLFDKRHSELKRRAPVTTPELHKLDFDPLDFPHIDGSTSTQPLAVMIACRYFGVDYGWRGGKQVLIRDGRDGTRPEWEMDIIQQHREPEAELTEYTVMARADDRGDKRLAPIINNLLATNASTHQAYLNLLEGSSDIGLLAREPSDEERKLAKERDVDFEVTPCALDAFVFIVNRFNPIHGLTSQNIRDIYSGKVTYWRGVGGADREITSYQREEDSGSQQLMQSLVMKDLAMMAVPRSYSGDPPPAQSLIGSLMSSVFLELTRNKKGIAFSLFYYEQFMSGSPRTRTIAVDGVRPSAKSIADRSYPFLSEVFVVTRRGIADDSPAAKLRSWLLSPEGQALVRESGYVPLGRSF
jgi:phosphate transport system substrate-binding protein